MTLGQGHGIPLDLMDNNCVKYYLDPTLWPRHRFCVCVHCNLDLEDTCMTFVQGHDTSLCHGQQIQHGSKEVHVWSEHIFRVCVHCDLDPGDMTLTQDHDTPLGHGQQLCKILTRSNMAARSYSPDIDFDYVFTKWPWPWRYDHWPESWHTLWHHRQQLCENIIRIQQCSEELWPRHGFCVCMHCNLDIGDTCIVWPSFKVMTHPCSWTRDPTWQ